MNEDVMEKEPQAEAPSKVESLLEENDMEKKDEIEKEKVVENLEKEAEKDSEKEKVDEMEVDTVKEVSQDVKTRFDLMESKMKVSEIDLNMKISMAESNLGKKIDENFTTLSGVEGTLDELLKDQQEQNETNKALTDFLVNNFL
ncbi:hypothetical protein Dimus_005784, partial [Dionaea muscipula]